ncbi:cupin domain-containing protein [Streptomyces diastatochromogenes]|uniref:cupin domain-containing protein n=1 Tax=Streptomyces diastatochromogenes TaxID=42236 RepID=UPI0026BD83A0
MENSHRPPTAKGLAATFTGDVWGDGIYADAAPDRARLAIVRFAPGARSHWHAHRLGWTLHIVGGIALLGSRDGTVTEARPGDTVCTAPGEKHWHGAAPTASWPTWS